VGLAVALVVVAFTAALAAPPSMEEAVRTFYLGMAATDPEENRRAMRAMMPEAEDFAVLFPQQHEALWKMWQADRDRLVERAPQNAAQYRAVLPLGEVRAVDLRREGPPAYQRAIAEMPKDVPVLAARIEVAGPERERRAAAFVLVRGRWVWIWGLERVGAIAAFQTQPRSAPPR